MNKRIEELVKQASFEETTMTNFIAGPRQIFYGDEAHMQKFAELIVKECAKEAFNFWCNQLHNDEESAQSHIKKHFGVKE